MDPSTLGLGGRVYYSYNETHPRIEAYNNYMTTIAKLMNVTGPSTERFVENTIEVERRLAQVRKATEQIHHCLVVFVCLDV